MQKYVNLVDLVKSFPTSIYLQKSASIQPRTSPSKIGGKFNSLFICLLTACVRSALRAQKRSFGKSRKACAAISKSSSEDLIDRGPGIDWDVVNLKSSTSRSQPQPYRHNECNISTIYTAPPLGFVGENKIPGRSDCVCPQRCWNRN